MKRKISSITIILLCAAALLILLFFILRPHTADVITEQSIRSAGFVMGVVPFNPAQSEAEAADADVEYFDDLFSGCSAVEAGRVDGYADDRVLLERYARSNRDTTVMPLSYCDTDICGVMRNTDSELCARISAFIREAKASGLMDDILQRWYHGEAPELPHIEPAAEPSGTLRIITSAACEPYNYMGENAQLLGIEIELGMRIAEYLGMDPEFVVVDSYSLITALGSERGDIVLSSYNPNTASNDFIFTEPYAVAHVGVLVQSKRLADASRDDDADFWADAARSFSETFITEGRWKMMLQGLGVTLIISLVSFLFGNLLGDGLCRMMRSKKRIVHGLASGYIKLISSIPILILLMLLYYIMFKGISISGIVVSVIAFGMSTAAELAVLFGTGIDSVPKGQLEAADSIGFTKRQTFRLIILPQAAHEIFDLYKWQFVSLIKSTSVVGYIAILDLTKVNDIIRSRTYAPFFPLICSTVIYFLVTQLIALVLDRLGNRIDPARRPRVVRGVNVK